MTSSNFRRTPPPAPRHAGITPTAMAPIPAWFAFPNRLSPDSGTAGSLPAGIEIELSAEIIQ